MVQGLQQQQQQQQVSPFLQQHQHQPQYPNMVVPSTTTTTTEMPPPPNHGPAISVSSSTSSSPPPLTNHFGPGTVTQMRTLDKPIISPPPATISDASSSSSSSGSSSAVLEAAIMSLQHASTTELAAAAAALQLQQQQQQQQQQTASGGNHPGQHQHHQHQYQLLQQLQPLITHNLIPTHLQQQQQQQQQQQLSNSASTAVHNLASSAFGTPGNQPAVIPQPSSALNLAQQGHTSNNNNNNDNNSMLSLQQQQEQQQQQPIQQQQQLLINPIAFLNQQQQQQAQQVPLTVQDRPMSQPVYNGVNPQYPGLRVLNAQPPIFCVDNFLTQHECDFLIQNAQDSFGPAPVVGKGSGEISPSRTSSTCYLAREDLPDMMRKVSLLTGKPIEHCELPQVGRYMPSQQYLQHYDAFDLSTVDGCRFAANGGQRTITVLIYLNDVMRGGATRFPALNLEVQPRRGMALIFFPATIDGMLDKMALHAAMPAVDPKFVSQVWIRQSNYTGQPSKRLSLTMGVPFGQEHTATTTQQQQQQQQQPSHLQQTFPQPTPPLTHY